MKVLVVDVGGTHVKILTNGAKEKREIDSRPTMTAAAMVSGVKKLAADRQIRGVMSQPRSNALVLSVGLGIPRLEA